MIPNSCFMFGSRDAAESEYPRICQAVEEAIGDGVRLFIVGRYGHFDGMARRAVCQAKRLHPQVRLEILAPYYNCRAGADPLPPGADGWLYPEGMERVPRQYAIVRANRLMAGNVEQVIAGVYHGLGNSAKLLRHVRSISAGRGAPIRIRVLAQPPEA